MIFTTRQTIYMRCTRCYTLHNVTAFLKRVVPNACVCRVICTLQCARLDTLQHIVRMLPDQCHFLNFGTRRLLLLMFSTFILVKHEKEEPTCIIICTRLLDGCPIQYYTEICPSLKLLKFQLLVRQSDPFLTICFKFDNKYKKSNKF